MVSLICVLLGCNIGIVDIGSTGTRLNIYGYRGDKIEKVVEFENSPGLSELGDDKIKEKTLDLFQRASLSVRDIKKIPIGIYGTAGLRGIGEREAGHKLKVIKSILHDYNVRECRIITGIEEGKLAFDALKFIIEPPNLYYSINHNDLALIDMGGKSVQLVYLTNGEEKILSYELGHKEGVKEIINVDCEEMQAFCVQRIAFKLLNLSRIEELSHRKVYLSSFFYDVFYKHTGKNKITLRELIEIFNGKCGTLNNSDCKDLFYLISFLNKLGIKKDKEMNLLGCHNGLRFNWSLSKSFELLLGQ